MDIETVADLSAESRMKLAQAKSNELTPMLITESLTSGKSWEDIKNILCFIISNSDIYTSISQFMKIKQKENESLVANILHFKREAKWCCFTNNAATISLFIKGLKNAHTVATQVYEKAPKTLTDAINIIEKLQAAQ